MQLCHRSRFAQKTIGNFRIARKLTPDDFDGDGSLEIEVRGKVNGAHAAGSNLTFYSESACNDSGNIHF
jgi:hypothetical protein